jgi:hypothetical protein
MPNRYLPIEITVAEEGDERPAVESGTRLDVAVRGGLYPTARLNDGRYAAWWFEAENSPELDDEATTEWVAAPTRFLAAATLSELWDDPVAFDRLVTDGGPANRPSSSHSIPSLFDPDED